MKSVLFARIICVLAASMLGGCPNKTARNRSDPPILNAEADFIEYTDIRFEMKTHVLVSGLGAGRMDLILNKDDTSIIVAAPIDEAQRLIALGDAMIDVLATSVVAPRGDFKIVIHSRRAGHDRIMQLLSDDKDRNNVLKGLLDEMDMVASADLIRSISRYEYARVGTGKGDKNMLPYYYSAAAAFQNWESSYFRRYPPRVFEPEVDLISEYTDAHGRGHAIRGFNLPEISALPDITPDGQVQLMDHFLSVATKPFILKSSGTMTILITDSGGLLPAGGSLSPMIVETMRKFGPPWQ